MGTKQDGTGVRRLFGRGEGFAGPARSGRVSGPVNVINDAAAYGVTIKPAVVAPGGFFWQAVLVHHLSPQENGGNHHIYMDLFDPALPGGDSPYGPRVEGGQIRVNWDGGVQTVTIDKPADEPGANFPIWKWQVCSVEALGAPGSPLPSDTVAGIHSGHPDEAPGNTLFHHSFGLTFIKVRAPDQVHTDSVVHGVIHRAAGRKIVLRKGGTTVATQAADVNEGFRFAGLGAGQYTIGVEGTQFESAQVTLDGRNVVQLDLTLVVAESVISGKVKNGAGRTVRLLRGDTEARTQSVAADESFRFAGLAEGAYRVALAQTDIVSPVISVNGVSTGVTELVAPASERALGHYVLFGPASAPSTRANLLLAGEFLFAFRPAFGFDPAEASHAGMVTIVGDTVAVAAGVEQMLKASGTPVQRISGSVDEVARALAARVASKTPFS